MNGGWFALGVGSSVVAGISLAASLAVMEVSSSSAFCGSCHAMKKYHASWSSSTHREVDCVECHIPDGLEAKAEKKLQGLSMLANTLTGSAPDHLSAKVDDGTCLKCHERRLLVGREWFGSVLFDHRPHLAELRRGVRLTCSSCHSQIVQGNHTTVTADSCLICHFMKREPRAPETQCSMCHQVDGMVSERNGRRFDHSRAVELDIDCESCHQRGPREIGVVPRERCMTCHRRPEWLVITSDTRSLMESHVNESKALCSDCHRELQHVEDRHLGPDPKRCSGCHEPRRTPQLNLYTGLGRNPQALNASPMYMAGVRCEACHEESPGMTAEPADARSCLGCHPLGIEKLFGWWLDSVQERRVIARELHTATTAEIDPATSFALREAGREIVYVERGHGVHNLVLSMSLLDSAVENLQEARLGVGLEPFEPPWPQAMPDSECLRCHRGTESRSVSSFGRDFGHAVHIAGKNLGCERCHSRHEERREQGAEVLLFDEPDCQGCHHEQIDLETCGSCHQDRHRAQFAEVGCDDCHVADFWAPTPGFDHHTTVYPLTGKHLEVGCDECHLEEDAGGSVVVRYRGIAYQRCEDCHEDSHAIQLGPACEDCHVTADWRQVDRTGFDHCTTRYTLQGRHADVECESCHPPGKPTRLERYDACVDCHDDQHQRQFAARVDGGACEPCHSVSGFLPTTYSPDEHGDCDFPLRGAHLAVPCDSCHQEISTVQLASLLQVATPAYHPEDPSVAVQFLFEFATCEACHEDPHAGSTDSFMGDRGCEVCHNEVSWREASYEHREGSFWLEGRHREVECLKCHPPLIEGAVESVQLVGVPTSCDGCHENPHVLQAAAGARTSTCERCHSAENWESPPFDHQRDTRFPLVAAHAETACNGCHADSRYEQASSECRDCHTDPHRGELGITCERCHTPHGWSYNAEALTSHSSTLFPLDGAHSTLDCGLCHDQEAPFEYSSTPTDCYACHAEEHRAAVSPDHELLSLPTECADCHDAQSWLGASIDSSLTLNHDLVFELAGAHRGLDCFECHRGGYGGTSRECVSCHRDDFDRAVEPDHRLAGFPADCELCHSSDRWEGVAWSHGDADPLIGAHRGLECTACHGTGFGATSSDCYSCHQVDFVAAVDPDHVAAGFDTDCTACHNQRSWARGRFGHEGAWPLTGAHRGLDCVSCHADGYVGLSGECSSCHLRDYRRVVDPDHRQAGFSTGCDECHGTRTWSGARFDHDLVFYLRGAHRRADCVECHTDGYTGTPRDCYSCHRGDYDAVRDPDHRAAGFDLDCTACHSEDDWRDARIDHESSFPLTGAHRHVDCVACHADGYGGTPRDCVDCHRADYNATRDPDHRAAGFALDCLACHTNDGWRGASFEHELVYPLTGAHTRVDCASCHASGGAGTPRDCWGCHRDDYRSPTDPDHVAAGFSRDCTRCHTTDRWPGASIDHDPYFPLTGLHTQLGCSDCHSDGFPGTPSECSGCHINDYLATVNPNHAAAGFPTDCTFCHTTDGWPGASFNHDLYYLLTGVHTRLDCTACHSDGFPGTPRECSGCHLDEYLATTHPDHEAAQFPTTCDDCHGSVEWYGARFEEHEGLFPIYRGEHDFWNQCTTCHRITGDYQTFSCTHCHSHRRDKMDRFHMGVPGYEYSSPSCYACHPTGQVL